MKLVGAAYDASGRMFFLRKICAYPALFAVLCCLNKLEPGSPSSDPAQARQTDSLWTHVPLLCQYRLSKAPTLVGLAFIRGAMKARIKLEVVGKI